MIKFFYVWADVLFMGGLEKAQRGSYWNFLNPYFGLSNCSNNNPETP